jgi:hypothetical protein
MTIHKATPEQWADIEKWNSTWGGFYGCLLELRARIEELEAITTQSHWSSSMTDLSPAAQQVLDAFMDSPVDAGNYYATRSRQIAAALRAAADQVHHHWDGMECVDYLCAIAAELEAQ